MYKETQLGKKIFARRDMLKEKLRCASIQKFDIFFVDRQVLFQTYKLHHQRQMEKVLANYVSKLRQCVVLKQCGAITTLLIISESNQTKRMSKTHNMLQKMRLLQSFIELDKPQIHWPFQSHYYLQFHYHPFRHGICPKFYTAGFSG